MISRRLTKIQKAEIVEAYREGDNANSLAEKYGCTTNTINRTIKTLLSDNEYRLLKDKRSKISNKKRDLINNKIINVKQKNIELTNSLDSFKEDNEVDSISSVDLEDSADFVGEIPSETKNSISLNEEKNYQSFDNNFEEIEPLISNFDFDIDKKNLDFEILNYESLPESVYMIVDKKVELDLQSISDLPEWSFLPENELKRNAILLFSNQRSAKRSCSRNQRVIKIPNTNVFKLSKSYLVSKGITRLILEDSIIALDN